jgi:hypothetical protein
MYEIKHWKWSSLYYLVNTVTCEVLKYSTDKAELERILKEEYQGK